MPDWLRVGQVSIRHFSLDAGDYLRNLGDRVMMVVDSAGESSGYAVELGCYSPQTPRFVDRGWIQVPYVA